MLTVETGEGIELADSYVSVEEADAYFESFGNTDWTTAEESAKEIALRVATRDIDLIWGPIYRGTPFTLTQSLLFPRVREGIPTGLKRATFELALLVLDGEYSPTAPSSGDNYISEETDQFGDLKFTVKYAKPRPDVPQLDRIRLMLSGLISLDTTVWQIPLVRG